MTRRFSLKTYSLVLSLIILFGCSDEDELNQMIVGEWQIIAFYDGYIGGTYQWNAIYSNGIVPSIIEFKSNGKYCFGGQSTCDTYKVLSKNRIEIKSSTGTSQHEIELDKGTLIIDYQVREGVRRNKFVLVDR